METLLLCKIYVLKRNIQKPYQNGEYLYPDDQRLIDPNKYIDKWCYNRDNKAYSLSIVGKEIITFIKLFDLINFS